jgi:hypothetical protein
LCGGKIQRTSPLQKFLKQQLTLPRTEADCCVRFFPDGGGEFVEFEVTDLARTPHHPSAKPDNFDVRTSHDIYLRLILIQFSSGTTHICCRRSTGSGWAPAIEIYWNNVIRLCCLLNTVTGVGWTIGGSTINSPDPAAHPLRRTPTNGFALRTPHLANSSTFTNWQLILLTVSIHKSSSPTLPTLATVIRQFLIPSPL